MGPRSAVLVACAVILAYACGTCSGEGTGEKRDEGRDNAVDWLVECGMGWEEANLVRGVAGSLGSGAAQCPPLKKALALLSELQRSGRHVGAGPGLRVEPSGDIIGTRLPCPLIVQGYLESLEEALREKC